MCVCVFVGLLCVVVQGIPCVCFFSDCIRNPGFNMFDLNRDLTTFLVNIHSIKIAPFVVFANLTCF